MKKLMVVSSRQHGVFSARQARAAGVAEASLRRLVRRGVVVKVCRGVFAVAGSPRTHRQMAMAAVLAAGPGAVACRRTAAWLLGLPGFGPRGIEVCRRFGKSERAPIGWVHRSRRLPDDHVTVIDGIPCTTAARTLFDLAGAVRPGRCARAVDNALSRSLVSFRGLTDVFITLASRGRRGTRAMRRILAERGPHYVAPASELEALAWDVFTGAGLRLDKQVDVGDTERWIGRVDFRVRGTRVLIEADGRRYHSSLLDAEADRRRDEALRAAGWIVVRVTWDELTNRPADAVRRVVAALAAAA
jgi:very-short-patch-repair endonuclease